MVREAHLDLAIGTLYEAAVEPERWPAALTATADLLGAVGSQFYFWNRHQNATQFAMVGRLPEDGNAAYLRYYGAIDTRRQALERVPVGTVAAYGLDFDEGRFRNSEFYNDFLVPHGVPYVAGARPFETGDLSGVIAILRNFRQGPFGQPELAALGRLIPHLQRAARLHLRMGELSLQNQTVEAALDRLQFGVVIADVTGRALVVNRAAQEMAAAKDGLLLRGGASYGGSTKRSERSQPMHRQYNRDRKAAQGRRRRLASDLKAFRSPSVRAVGRSAQPRWSPRRTTPGPRGPDSDHRPRAPAAGARASARRAVRLRAMPRARLVPTSMLSRPTPSLPTTSSLRQASSSAPLS